jgi:predicted outer membrane repeat protein
MKHFWHDLLPVGKTTSRQLAAERGDMRDLARPILFVLLIAATVAQNAPAADQVVTHCGDSGLTTQLRAKIANANASGGGVITFTCGPATIVLTAQLPTITQNILINGANEIRLSGANSYRLFSTQAPLQLRNLIVSNGFANNGGAVFVEAGGHLLTDAVRFEINYAQLDGGAIYADRGQLNLVDTVFEGNHAESDGGAVYNFKTVTEMFDVDFLDNTAGEYSGAISNDSGFVGWDGGVALRNEGHDAGVLDNYDPDDEVTQGQVEIRRVRFERNESAFGEGAVFVNFVNTSFEVEDSIFQDNESAGGGIIANQGFFEVANSLFYDNNSTTGGVLYNQNGDAYFTNVTMSKSYADVGQTIWQSGGTVDLNRVTIVGDTVGNGSNLHVEGGGTMVLSNTVVVRPPSGGNNCNANGGTIQSNGFNLSDDASCDGAFTANGDDGSVDPELGPLADNGGPTPTHLPLPGSPLVDGGNAVACPAIDQRGVERPQDAACDIGAVEVASCEPPVPTLCGDATGDGSVSAPDALRALRVSVGAVECGPWLCDYNGVGGITASDALAILRRSVGQATPANCPDPWDCREELF